MIVTLPTFTDPFYSFTTTLDGADFVFDFRFNQRAGVWYFNVSLPDGTELTGGIKVVCRRSFLHRFADVRLPQGLLIAVASGEDESPPGLEELGEGRRVSLVYVPVGESLE